MNSLRPETLTEQPLWGGGTKKEISPGYVLDLLKRKQDQLGSAIKLDVKRDRWPKDSQRNLERLEKGEAIAVITGQQPCLFGGPSLILHKLLTTLNIVRWLEGEGVSAVPVFWNASEDHDLQEMLQVGLLNGEGEIRTYREEGLGDQVSAEVLSAFDLPEKNPEFSPFVRQALGETSRRYAEQFSDALLRMFEDHGLVVVEPRDLVAGAEAFWENIEAQQSEILRAYELSEKEILQRGQALQAPRRYPLPVFGIHGSTGQRKAYQQIVGDQAFEIKNLKESGYRPSPGALLRPLMAQWCLPIGVTVLGPAEAKYHEQLLGAFKPLGLATPMIWPRLGGTWIPDWVDEQLEMVGMSAEQVIHQGRLNTSLGSSRELAIKGLSAYLSALRQEGVGLGKSGYVLDRLDRDLFSALGRFERGLLKEEMAEKGVTPKDADRLLRFLLPRGVYQERSLGWADILKGPQHLDKIQESFMDPFDWRHRIYS